MERNKKTFKPSETLQIKEFKTEYIYLYMKKSEVLIRKIKKEVKKIIFFCKQKVEIIHHSLIRETACSHKLAAHK